MLLNAELQLGSRKAIFYVLLLIVLNIIYLYIHSIKLLFRPEYTEHSEFNALPYCELLIADKSYLGNNQIFLQKISMDFCMEQNSYCESTFELCTMIFNQNIIFDT